VLRVAFAGVYSGRFESNENWRPLETKPETSKGKQIADTMKGSSITDIFMGVPRRIKYEWKPSWLLGGF
jgi:hypothetical protein